MVTVITCWDDGHDGDLRLTEVLRRHGAKATFNLIGGTYRAERYPAWKHKVDGHDVWQMARGELPQVYAGFDIANHTFSHRSPASHAQMVEEIVRGRAVLEDIFQRPIRGFVYPGGRFDDTVKTEVRRAGHVYARTTRETDRVFPPADPCEFHPTCHFLAPDFWDRFARAKAQDGVFYFWGHSYEILTDPQWQTFEAAIRRLSSDPDVRWRNVIDLFTGASPG